MPTIQICPVSKLDEFFKISSQNRKICEKHVGELAEAIKKENLLEINPIIINHEKEIISGQHRWAAAKRLGVPVYYIVHKFSSNSDFVLTSNSNQRRSTLPDSVQYYAEIKGDPAYKQLYEYSKKTKISIGALCALLGNSVTNTYSKELMNGKFTFELPEERRYEIIEKYLELKSYLSKMELHVPSQISGVPFCKGFHKFLDHKIDWNHFMHRVRVDWQDFDIVFVKYEDWYKRFVKVYGKRCSKNKIK